MYIYTYIHPTLHYIALHYLPMEYNDSTFTLHQITLQNFTLQGAQNLHTWRVANKHYICQPFIGRLTTLKRIHVKV